MVFYFLEESNKAKKPLEKFEIVNPLEFLKLFQTKSQELTDLTWASAAMCFAEGKNIVDVTMNYIVNDCMCDEAEASYMVSSFGLSMISSGVLSKPMLKRMGARLFTTFSNLLTIVLHLQNLVLG